MIVKLCSKLFFLSHLSFLFSLAPILLLFLFHTMQNIQRVAEPLDQREFGSSEVTQFLGFKSGPFDSNP